MKPIAGRSVRGRGGGLVRGRRMRHADADAAAELTAGTVTIGLLVWVLGLPLANAWVLRRLHRRLRAMRWRVHCPCPMLKSLCACALAPVPGTFDFAMFIYFCCRGLITIVLLNKCYSIRIKTSQKSRRKINKSFTR